MLSKNITLVFNGIMDTLLFLIMSEISKNSLANLVHFRLTTHSERYSKKKEILAFYIFSFMGFLLNVALMFVLTEYLLIWYVVAKTLVTMAVAVFNFIARKNFVFLE